MTGSTTRQILDAALAYAKRGWHVFPCHTPTPQGCSCRQDCGRIGKHPRTEHGLKDATTDEATIRRWWRQFPQANIGIATGAVSGLVVLDNDIYKGGDGSLRELEQSYSPLPATVLSLTGGGGEQYFFQHPGTHVKNGVESLGAGLDIRGDGGYVIAPPSLHKSGKQYTWDVVHEPDEIPLASIPAWLLALCQEASRHATPDAGEPILDGARNDTLFRLGCSFRAKGCTETVILAALREINATQCQPPLDEKDVEKIAASCAKYAAGQARHDAHQRQNGHRTGDKTQEHEDPPSAFDLAAFLERLAATPEADRFQMVLDAMPDLAFLPLAAWLQAKRAIKTQIPTVNLNDLERLRTELRQDAQARAQAETTAARPAWQKALFTTKAGDVLETANNLQAIFAHHDQWQDRLWWDVVANRAYLDDQHPLDIHYVNNEVVPWLGAEMRMPVYHSQRVLDVMRSWAQRCPRDPIQEWLHTLPASDPEDPKRTLLNTWLHRYAGAEDTPYTRFISRILPVSLVKRALCPGVQYRYVVVLEGEENLGKTKLLRLLGDRWHQEFPKSVEGKEAYMQLQGYWLVELGELDALKPAQETRIKMFISQQMDVWVPKYENDVVERPRRAILVGTTNEREYLKGEHGNTRYLPLWVDGPIQHNAIAAVRDCLFTQAKAFLADHAEDWWCISDDIEEEVAHEREARREPSVFEDALRPFLLQRHRCTVAEALEYLQISKDRWSKRLEMDVAKAIKGCGWYRHVARDAVTKKVSRFWADTPQEKSEVPF